MCGVSFVLFTTFLDKKLLPGKIGMACYAIPYFCFCLTAVFSVLVLFQKHLNFTTGLLGNLSTNSYAVYFIHYFVILWIILVLRELQGNAFVKWPSVGILSVTISYLAPRYALSKTHIFGATVRSIQGSR
jgi:surface polysaccharide O-acyltransferase-like enzyme